VVTPSRTTLVVDDDPSIRMLCRLNLELDGWRVLEAGTLAEARDRLATEQVAVVLLDVHVGSSDGIEFMHELHREHAGLKVALLTGADRVEDLGSDAVIPKPFTLDQLTTTVARLAG
jgi:two-component system OmpR family response regulator